MLRIAAMFLSYCMDIQFYDRLCNPASDIFRILSLLYGILVGTAIVPV